MKFYVYSYTKPGAKSPFYIGKGSRTRATDHLKEKNLSGKTLFYKTLKSLLNDGIAPQIRILARFATEKEAYSFEIVTIAKYGRLDLGTGTLTNHTDGGKRAIGLIRAESNFESYDLEFGFTLQRFATISELRAAGYKLKSVRSVLKKQNSQYKGVGWRLYVK